MRWFKHLTSSSRDEKLCRVRDEFGLAGYGLYWLVLEAVAEQMDERDKTFLTLSRRGWREATGCYPKTFARFLDFCRELGLLEVAEQGDLLRVDCPNLLKYRDEYSRKKRVGQASARNVSGQAPDREADSDTQAEADPAGKAGDAEQHPPFPGLPLRGGGEFFLRPEQARELAPAHPGTDLFQALSAMRAWLLANPGRRKTRAGIMRFVNGWLARERDAGPGRPGAAPAAYARTRDMERQAMARAILEQEDAEHEPDPARAGQAEHPLPAKTLGRRA